MTEQLVTFKTAKLAKELGFKSDDIFHYVNEYGNYYDEKTHTELREFHVYFNGDVLYRGDCCYKEDLLPLPSQSLLQKWLRDVYKIQIEVWYNFFTSVWEISIYLLDKTYDSKRRQYIIKNSIIKKETYEEALEEGLFESLKLI